MKRSPLFSAMMGSPAAGSSGVLYRSGRKGARSGAGEGTVLPTAMALRIDVMRISPARGEPLALPSYATDGSAGVDLRADAEVTLAPGERALVPKIGRAHV